MHEIEIDFPYAQITENSEEDHIISVEYGGTPYNYFFQNFMVRNRPCIIKNVSTNWECTNKWIANNAINHDYFIHHYGDLEAPVADCNVKYYNAQEKSSMKVANYMEYLQKYNKERVLYLKDWHLKKLRPGDCFYEVPKFFASDWLNEYALDKKQDDFMFVYIGPKESWTPLHVDVYYSYSWSINVVGKKKWIFFPPGEENKLKDSLHNLPVLFDPGKFSNIKYFEVIQEKGDALFVPSGWHHQVINLLDTISINHNWINACNIERVWKELCENFGSVELEINEFRDTPEFTSQCQLILKSLFGMDFKSFVELLCHIGEKRLTQLQGGKQITFNNYNFGKKHISFDLMHILKVLNFVHEHTLPLNKYLTPNEELHFVNIQKCISSTLEAITIPTIK